MNWKDKLNSKFIQISLYVIIIIGIYFLIQILANAPVFVFVILDKLGWILNVIKPVIIGFAFAYVMDPMVNLFEHRFRELKEVRGFKRIVAPRTWAAFVSVLILIVAFAGLISLLVFTVTDQLRLANFDDITKVANGFMANFNGFYQAILTKLNHMNIQSQQFEQYVKNASIQLVNGLMNFAKSTITSITNMSGYLTTIIFSFIIGFYFMIDGRLFTNYIRKISAALFSEKTNKKLQRAAHDLDEVFSGYIRGQLLDAFVMMLLISLVLTVTGVKFAVVIGIFAGIGNLIPYFGPIVAYVSTSLVCLINGDIKTWIISMISLLLIQAIDGNLIGPKLLSQSIKIHPLIIIVSLIFGSAVGGFLGMLLAVPVGAYLKLVFARYVEHRLEEKKEGNS